MASINCIVLALTFAFTVRNVAAGSGSFLRCEELSPELCAFAVSSTTNRCVLEKSISKEGTSRYECQTSGITAEEIGERIEEDECISWCGLKRVWVGMSTDALMASDEESTAFKSGLCSDKCQNNCPNVVHLFSGLCAGEGILLPDLCKTHHNRARRLAQFSSSMASSASVSVAGSPAELPSVLSPLFSAVPLAVSPATSPAEA